MDFLESALADPDFAAQLTAAVDGAATISDVPRRHLKHGIAHASEGDLFDAWPPLLIGLEGTFVDVAVDRGLLARQGNHVVLTDTQGNPTSRKLSGVEQVIRMVGHSPESSDIGLFLTHHVYGGEGNPFRHGTARPGCGSECSARRLPSSAGSTPSSLPAASTSCARR